MELVCLTSNIINKPIIYFNSRRLEHEFTYYSNSTSYTYKIDPLYIMYSLLVGNIDILKYLILVVISYISLKDLPNNIRFAYLYNSRDIYTEFNNNIMYACIPFYKGRDCFENATKVLDINNKFCMYKYKNRVFSHHNEFLYVRKSS